MIPPSEVSFQRGFNEVTYVKHSTWLIVLNKTEPYHHNNYCLLLVKQSHSLEGLLYRYGSQGE